MSEQYTISPVNNQIYATRKYAWVDEIESVIKDADEAFAGWRATPLADRVQIVKKFADVFLSMKEEAAKEITWQIGRPIMFAGGEVNGLIERTLGMASLAEQHLADQQVELQKPGFKKFIRREPLGVVVIIAPWNYPLLTAVNGIVPSLLAGNTVILKHSYQTPLCADRFIQAFRAAGLPEKVLQILNIRVEDTSFLLQHPLVRYVNFTGSVPVGQSIAKALKDRPDNIDYGLELGGKDPAYVRPDCDLKYTVAQLVDGAYFNSGQSCCSIERIYVHESVYEEFVKLFVEQTLEYALGDPTEEATTLGPVVRVAAADNIRAQIDAAVQQGARALIDKSLFPADQPGTPYLAPQVLVDVDHTMSVMIDETFGPVVGIMKVASDDEAILLMNDSPFGLSASVWTKDEEAALRIGDQIETGTWFMNRCDYLDPELAWVGVKSSGRGGPSLSKFAFDPITRPKSYHLKVNLEA